MTYSSLVLCDSNSSLTFHCLNFDISAICAYAPHLFFSQSISQTSLLFIHNLCLNAPTAGFFFLVCFNAYLLSTQLNCLRGNLFLKSEIRLNLTPYLCCQPLTFFGSCPKLLFSQQIFSLCFLYIEVNWTPKYLVTT